MGDRHGGRYEREYDARRDDHRGREGGDRYGRPEAAWSGPSRGGSDYYRPHGDVGYDRYAPPRGSNPRDHFDDRERAGPRGGGADPAGARGPGYDRPFAGGDRDRYVSRDDRAAGGVGGYGRRDEGYGRGGGGYGGPRDGSAHDQRHGESYRRGGDDYHHRGSTGGGDSGSRPGDRDGRHGGTSVTSSADDAVMSKQAGSSSSSSSSSWRAAAASSSTSGTAERHAADDHEEEEEEEEQPEETEEERAARVAEESRRRREAILAKHRAAAPTATDAAAPAAVAAAAPSTAAAAPPAAVPPIAPAAAPPFTVPMPVAGGGSALAPASSGGGGGGGAGGGAGGARSSMFDDDDEDSDHAGRITAAAALSHGAGAVPAAAPVPVASSTAVGGAGVAATPAAATPAARPTGSGTGKSFSMFDDDDDAILEAAGVAAAADSAAVAAAAAASSSAAAMAVGALVDNYDDHEGYYKAQVGETLEKRYVVTTHKGRGVFSSVVICRDKEAIETAAGDWDDDATLSAAATAGVSTHAAPMTLSATGAVVRGHAALATGSCATVAIKIIRANDTMRRAGAKELEILRTLATADPDGRYHCVRLLHTFEHRNHLCLAFEPLHMNLKEVQNKFGKGVGISIAAVRSYAKQMLLALSLLAKLRIIHADIKPHNILANERYNVIKLADFGSAFKEDDPDNVPTPLLVSRFYRAPEIILGYTHTPALDMWSIACCLYELYTGDPLFPGADNNDMLWQMQAMRGKLPHRMVKFHLRQVESLGVESHFDADLRFRRNSVDSISKAPVVKAYDAIPPAEDLNARLMEKRAPDDDKRVVNHLKDLLDKMLVLDPTKRISVKDAINHPFVRAGIRMRPDAGAGSTGGAAASGTAAVSV